MIRARRAGRPRRPRRGPVRHRLLALVVLLLPVCLVGALGTGNAQAAGYRYWSFWESDGGDWSYATQGPGTARPADGTVTGFRFSVSEDGGNAARPRHAPDFAAICGDTPGREGRIRIGVVVDPGTAADAPAGERAPALRAECALLGEDATAAEALAAVAEPLRYSGQGLLCAISGYPATGCGEQVTGRAPATPPAETGGTPGKTPGGTTGGTTDGTAGASAGTAADGTGGGTGGDGAGGGSPVVGLVVTAAAVLVLVVAGRRQARRRRG
ncbi:SCO2322 family protein [Streptomyces sp. NPDC088341]|uniref:SCO2322 family protein n=1 Tax=Streptomyces sp. NPDC088341 TaxID=3154870 RepID=UPI003428322B